MSDYLPQELITETLAWLPVKSLIRFRCVSKPWCSLITSPSFEALHLNKTTAKSSALLVFKKLIPYGHCKRPYIPPPIPYDNFHEFHMEKFSIPYWIRICIVGSCNGVICFTKFKSFILWNPSIGRTLTISFPKPSFNGDLCFLGFGFDYITNEYKMVYTTPTLAWVYSLRRGCWSTVTTDLNYYEPGPKTDSVFLDGACHWVTHSLQSGKPFPVIAVFDLGDKSFREIAVPDCLIGESEIRTMSLSTSDGLLLFAQCWNWQCDVWLMEENGVGETWIKLYNIQYICSFNRLLAVRRWNEIILESIFGEVVWCNPNTGEFTKPFNRNVLFLYLDNYMESLVLCREVTAGDKEADTIFIVGDIAQEA